MRFQDYIRDVTKQNMDSAFKYARAVPADKLEWRPAETSRSVLEICQELALCPLWGLEAITSEKAPEMNEEVMKEAQAEMAKFTTIDACEAECKKNLETLFQYVDGLSDEDLKKTKWLPYDGGRDFEVMEMADYPNWNAQYHLGQIAYIQTMYGDHQMH